MAYTFSEIFAVKESGGTGRDVAELVGLVYPSDSKVDEDLYLVTAGNRIAREAKAEIDAGNGHGLYGSKRRAGNGAGKKAVDPLATIEDIEIVMAARLAAKKAGITENGDGIRDAIETGNTKVIAFLDFALTTEQRAILEKAVGVLTPAEREAKRRADLIASIRMSVLRAAKFDSMRRELEAAGFAVEAPAWFAGVAGIDLPNIEAHSTAELEVLAAKFAS